MAFDFKKEYKEFYMPKNKPEIVTVPKANYIAVRGKGNPNEEGGAYQQAIGILYAVAYTLKMSYKTDYKIEGFFEYVVPPLEGFWWQDGVDGVDYTDKSTFNWISVIRLPDFVAEKDFNWAVETATKKKKLDCSAAEFLTIDEGLCVQIMHLGSFDDEPATVAIMDQFLSENGYTNDFSDVRLHHEIYMSDARKVAPEKWKTVIRHPIRKIRKVTMMKKYDKIFNSVETNEQKYQLASGYISTTTVLFENEGIAARIEAKGDVAFFDVNDYNEEVPMAEINIPEQTGGRQVYEDVLCSVDQDHIILKFPVVKWIDNYPHCDGEHDRWDSVIIGWHRLAFNMKTKNMAVETLE